MPTRPNAAQPGKPANAAKPARPAAAAGPAAAVEEEKDTFHVKITGVTGNKIQVIKVVRELTNLGLKEAKELVESAPNAVVADDVLKPEAEAMKAKLEESGASVDLV